MPSNEAKLKHLKKDRVLAKVIGRVGVLKNSKNQNLYLALMEAIVSQQLSVKAADTIWSRFTALFIDGYPKAEKVLKLSDDKLRSVGLSYQKAGYLKNIANFSLKQSLEFKELKKLSDEELINYLVQIKGVGRWTVEMLMMFSLNRENILPKDDLGIQNGIRDLYNITYTNKKELYAEMERVAEKWKPYRTLACRYIWRTRTT